jgi:hypothetical protein
MFLCVPLELPLCTFVVKEKVIYYEIPAFPLMKDFAGNGFYLWITSRT